MRVGFRRMLRTPLYHVHESLGAKFTEFGGWEMPLQYTGIVREHLAVRATVGLFDLSHMGEIEVRGETAGELLQRLSTNDVGRLTEGRALYTLFCDEDGGIVDDLLIYRYADTHYMLVVNAANIEKDLAWVERHQKPGTEVRNVSDRTALIALQGPKAIDLLNPMVVEQDISEIPFFRFIESEVAGIPATISRTGYTGEVGFELYVQSENAVRLWEAVYPDVVAASGHPVGLGARDTLRLEAGLRLYGMDMDEKTTPLEAGLGRFVKFKNRQFVGKQALLTQKREGVARQTIGFQMLDRSVGRAGHAVYHADTCVGQVTSGAPSPSLKRNIGFAVVASHVGAESAEIAVEIRGKLHPAKIVEVPFV